MNSTFTPPPGSRPRDWRLPPDDPPIVPADDGPTDWLGEWPDDLDEQHERAEAWRALSPEAWQESGRIAAIECQCMARRHDSMCIGG